MPACRICFFRAVAVLLAALLAAPALSALTVNWISVPSGRVIENTPFNVQAMAIGTAPMGNTTLVKEYVLGQNPVLVATGTPNNGFSTAVQTPPKSFTETGNKMVYFTANGADINGQASATVAVRVIVDDLSAPSAPGNLRAPAASVGNTQFTLEWDPAQDNIEYYEIKLNGVLYSYPVGGVPTTQIPAPQPQPASYSKVITGLTQGTTYVVTVQATDWAGHPASVSGSLSVTTSVPDITKPTAPGALFISNVGLSVATAQWGTSSDNVGVTGYTVKLLQGGTGGAVLSSWSTAATTTTFPFTGLSAGTTYGVSVTAGDAAGNQSTATTAPFTTDTATVPGPLSASKVQARSFTVSWNNFIVSPATSYFEVECNGVPTSAGSISGSPNLSLDYANLEPNHVYTLKVKAVGTTGTQTDWSDSITVTTDVDPVTLSQVTPPFGTGTSLVANLGGSLSVDNHGSANYSIPLRIPPGRAGLQPQPSLSYSSGGGNGVAGVGFSLSTGFAQSITRGRSILARDGVTQGITFSGSDKFYLDGKRLISTGTTAYGLPDSVYRTEVDSFVTITAFGSGANIDRFEVVDKSGTKSTFGKYGVTSDAFQKGGGETGEVAYAYALKRVEDLLGNYVTFTYNNLGGGEYVLKQIDYTGGTGGSPTAQVVFSYEDRPDQPVTYIANRSFNHRARLAVVTAQSGSVVTAQYALNYENDVNRGRSRLASVLPLLADPDPLNGNALQACPLLTIGWESVDNHLSSSGIPISAGPSGGDIMWGDTNGDGTDDLVVDAGYTNTTHTKLGDFDGDGKKDKLFLTITDNNVSVSIQRAVGAAPTINGTLLDSFFIDPGYTSRLLLRAEGAGVASRITVADFNGDGLDDILVHGFDGKVRVFFSQRTSFTDPASDMAHSPYIGGAGNIFWESGWLSGNHPEITSWVDNHYYVKPMPCDLNGDGRMDYACLTYQRILKYNTSGVPTGFVTFRYLSGVMSKSEPDGSPSFSSMFAIAQPPMGVPIETNDDGSIRIDDVNSGAMPGDFNGDGLTDFMVLVPRFEKQGNLFNYRFGGNRWVLFLNQGESSYGYPVFAQYNGPIPNTVVRPGVAGNVPVNTYYTPVKSTSAAHLGYLDNAVSNFTSSAPEGASFFTGMESAAGSVNTHIMDINHDGLADLVWYVAMNPDETTAASPGWYAMLSTGNFPASNPSLGFSGPIRVDFLNGVQNANIVGNYNYFSSSVINNSIDHNGDGHPDYFIQTANNGRPGGTGTVFLATATSGLAAPFNDVVKTVIDGFGRQTDVEYKAAKDSSVYTAGVDVAYPIREIRASTPVVANVWHDSGTGVATDRAQFSYQYSGNRLDLSGRGSLGFHAFVTRDMQTNLFKYQFLAQSFPMTGLTQREETYGGNDGFNYISSHDNTVVFDKVSIGGPSSGATLWPFISKAIEYRWEDGVEAATSSSPEILFATARPVASAHITIEAKSTFDGQSAPKLTLPVAITNAGYNPSDTNAAGGNTVVGTTSFATFSGLPGEITFGNLKQLSTDYDALNFPNQFTETVTTTYKPEQTINNVITLSGLVSTVSTTVVSPYGGTETGPEKSYTYVAGKPLVESETIDGTAAKATNGASHLKLTTTYEYNAGRVSKKTVSSPDSSIGTYQTYAASAWDANTDQPKSETNAFPYYYPTTTAYHSWLGLPTSVTDVNNAEVKTEYDALGRATKQTDVLRGLSTTNAFALDPSVNVAPPETAPGSGVIFNGVAALSSATGVKGVTLQSKYKVTVTATAKPTVTTYYDRLGRALRTIKDGFNGQQIFADTAYNNLGQTIATSLPYPYPLPPGQSIQWAKTTYDSLGRVVTVTAPNGTTTTNSYAGRNTTVKIKPLGGTERTNITQVDAKGRTVKVWNPDPLTGNASGTTSLEYRLDGFGRMLKTVLEGLDDTTHPITASYDSFGHQKTLNDPDKGNWIYTNNALGQVLVQTDAKQNATTSTFDHLGRPLSRITTSLGTAGDGSTETAGWFYYDTDADPATNRVALGAKGWIGALQRSQTVTTGNPGFAAPATVNTHYYDNKGRPSIDLTSVDNKWFYTCSEYDAYSRVQLVRHYWRPAGHELPNDQAYVWQDFGYTYNYDAKSYLLSITDSLNRNWWQADPTAGYDYLDRPVLVKKGNGYWTKRAFKPEDGTLTALKTGIAQGGVEMQNLGFVFDGLGNLMSRTGSGGTETLGYDNLNRLTSNAQGVIGYATNGNVSAKKDVTGAASGTYVYDSVHPHAVASAFGYGMTYDLNGNLLTRTKGTESWNIKWAGFDKPRWMSKTTTSPAATVGSEFNYDSNRSRVMQLEFDALSGGAPSHYVRKRIYGLGSTLEVNYDNTAASGAPAWALKKIRIYVPGPDGVIGAREFDPVLPSGGTETALVYHYDHLGSIESITPFGSTSTTFANDSTGKSGRFSEDAWGQRRNPFTWSGAPVTAANDPNKSDDGGADSLTPRGFTGHEMMDGLDLVNMNGRIYDPILGRFLSADLIVQFPGDLQSYNRYSYVQNNPLKFTDPSGFSLADDDKKEKFKEYQKNIAKLGYDVNIVRKDGGGVLFVFTKIPAQAASEKTAAAADNAQPAATPVKDRGDAAAPEAKSGDTVPTPAPTTQTASAAEQKKEQPAEPTKKETPTLPIDSSRGIFDVVGGKISVDVTIPIPHLLGPRKSYNNQVKKWIPLGLHLDITISKEGIERDLKVGVGLPVLNIQKAAGFGGAAGINFRLMGKYTDDTKFALSASGGNKSAWGAAAEAGFDEKLHLKTVDLTVGRGFGFGMVAGQTIWNEGPN